MENRSTTFFSPLNLFLWVVICSCTFPLSNIWIFTPFHRASSYHKYSESLNFALPFAFVLIPVFLLLANYLVLNRLKATDRLSIGAFIGCALYIVPVSMLVIFFEIATIYDSYTTSGIRWEVRNSEDLSAVLFNVVLRSHWLVVAGLSSVSALLIYTPICVLISRHSGFRFLHLITAVVIAALIHRLLPFFLDLMPRVWFDIDRQWDLSLITWERRAALLINRAEFGAAWGFSTFFLLKLLTRSKGMPGLTIAAMVCLGLLLLLTAVRVPYVFKGLYTDLSVATSKAPEQEISTGLDILSFVSEIDYPYPVKTVFSADKKNFSVIGKEHYIYNLSTGALLGETGSNPDLYNSYTAGGWTAGAKYYVHEATENVALPDAESKKTWEKKSNYYRKIRVFDGDTLALIAEHKLRERECSSSYHNQIAFEGSESVWVGCKGEDELESAPLAIEFSLPDLKITQTIKSDVKYYFRNMGLFNHREQAYAWYATKENFFIKILAENRMHLAPITTQNPELAGKLSFKSFEKNGEEIHLNYSGYKSSVTNPNLPTDEDFLRRALVFDFNSGDLLTTRDAGGVLDNPYPAIQLTGTPYTLETRNSKSSKKGQLVVTNSETGEVVQDIDTKSLKLMAVSPDLQWLIAYAPHQKSYRIYRIKLAP